MSVVLFKFREDCNNLMMPLSAAHATLLTILSVWYAYQNLLASSLSTQLLPVEGPMPRTSSCR